MAGVLIKTDEVVNCAVSIRQITSNLKNLFGDINKIMESLEDIYNTVNTEEIKKKYYGFEGQLDGLITAMEKYSAFIEDKAKMYEDVEKKLAQQAAEIIAVSAANAISDAVDTWM